MKSKPKKKIKGFVGFAPVNVKNKMIFCVSKKKEVLERFIKRSKGYRIVRVRVEVV